LQIATTTELSGKSNNGNFTFSRLSKVDFPCYDGDDVMGWLYKCEQFFKVLTSIQLSGKGLTWHQSFMKGRNRVWPGWSEYKGAICC